MDSVILFFGRSSYDEVERIAKEMGLRDENFGEGSRLFFFRRYSSEAINGENDAAETAVIERALGRRPSSAFVVLSRHGESARYALEVVAAIAEELPSMVLDDDFDNLWAPQQIREFLDHSSASDLYSLREWANNSIGNLPVNPSPR